MGCTHYAEKFTDYLRAGREECTPDELRKFARSPEHRVRLRVAEHTAAPRDVLELLSCDECADVRIAVAQNPNASPRLVWRLAADPDPSVRFGIAEDPCAPYTVLKLLTEDPCPYVSVRARKTLQSRRAQTATRRMLDGNRVFRVISGAVPKAPFQTEMQMA